MRQIGTIADEADARTLADYLLTLGITTRVDAARDGWAVWVHREELVERARKELGEFVKDPSDPRYRNVAQEAKTLRKKAEEEEKRHVKNTVDLRGRWAYRPVERCRLTFLLIGICVAVAFATEMGAKREPVLNKLTIAEGHIVPEEVVVDEDGDRVVTVPMRGRMAVGNLDEVRRGEVWRLLTPIFLHFGPIHLLFNMSMLYNLGGMIEMRRGTWRLAELVVVTALVSNLAQFYTTHYPYFGGMSGVVYGLFGYIWVKGRYDPAAGMIVSSNTVAIMLLWLVLCFTGAVGNIANAAHVAGLVVGMLFGFAPHARDELRRW